MIAEWGPYVAIKPRPRIANDAYYTGDALARSIVARLPIAPGDAALEPSAGGGSFASALLSAGASVTCIDLDPTARALRIPGVTPIVGDFLSYRTGTTPKWIIGNPPYSHAIEHVEQALVTSGRHVVFLLRLAFLESRKRAAFWKLCPAFKVIVLSKRPSFTGDGKTNSCAYAVFWWDRLHSGPTELEVM